MSKIINCPNCGKKNRINLNSDNSKAVCADCWTKLVFEEKTTQPPPPPPDKSHTPPTDDKSKRSNFGVIAGIALSLFIGLIWLTQNSNTTPLQTSTYSNDNTTGQSQATDEKEIPSTFEKIVPDENQEYSLTVTHTPKTARVRILNINPKYQDGIKLKTGKYHLEVSQDGYETSKRWVTLSKNSVFNFSLTLPKVAMPRSGAEQHYTNNKKIAPFKIKTSYGSNYLVKLVSTYSQDTIMTIFVKGGDTVTTKVPLGTYVVKYATGTEWYGYKHLFGKETGYSKADTSFIFENTGYQISGYTITLYRVSNGNLSTTAIDPSQF